MIKIIMDTFQKIKDSSNAITVNNEKEYMESRLKIREAYRKGQDIEVLVRNKRFKDWYRSLLENNYATKEEISLKSILAKGLEIKTLLIPFADEEVEELKLIEKAESSPPTHILTSVDEVKNWVLSTSLDRCWGEEGGTFEHIAKIASYFLSVNRKVDTESLFRGLVTQKEDKWRGTSLGSVYKWLLEAPEDNAFFLYVMQVTKNYEEGIKRAVIQEVRKNIKELDRITNYLDKMSLIECDSDSEKKEFSDSLEIKWKNMLRDRFQYKKGEIIDEHELEERFEKILINGFEQMSGKITGELNGLTSFIQENAQYFNERLFDIIYAKFSAFPEKMKELKEIIPLNFPAKPSKEWQWEKICDWVKDEYLPYKKWSIKQDLAEDKELGEYEDIYSNWLYENYPKMKNDIYPLNYGTWYVIKEYLKKGFQILWIIIDNLCWFYLEDVVEAFRKQDFSLAGIFPRLSMLPSETKVSKCALVAGKLSSQIDENAMYKDLFESFCKENSIETYSFIEDGNLRKDGLGEDMITCCIINKLDFSFHRADFDLEEDIKDSIKRWAKYIKNYIFRGVENKNLPRDEIKVIVSTDHGSCILPKGSRGYNKPDGAEIGPEHKRFVFVNQIEYIKDNWFYLDKDKFGLRESIAVIKGYNFVGKGKPKGLVHGGLTPEETFIPHLEFCLSPIKIKPIQCIHISDPIPLGNIKRKAGVAIRNPNEYEIKNIRIHILSHNVEIDSNRIRPMDEITKSFEISLPKETTTLDGNKMGTLKGYYGFECLGKEEHGEMEIKIKIRKIMIS